MPAADSLAQACLPLGLAHGCKMLRPVAAGQALSWSDVAVEENVPAVKLRRELETAAEVAAAAGSDTAAYGRRAA
ncbi:MAG: hypothetical protein FJY40_12460 [Betaproteobacteria bacterium]|nr:hypothetical protein [Betaproteobacteria bacterium]